MAATNQRSDSLASLLSAGTLTSESSVEVPLKQAVLEAKGNTSTNGLLQRALRRLASFEQDQSRLLPHPSDLPVSKKSERVDPYKVAKTMLEWAPSEFGRRYVAAAIVGCDDTSTLVDLSNTWLRYLLLPFKGNRTNAAFPPSEAASPTYHEHTAYSLDAFPINRDSSMAQLVRLREGYQCPITEVYYKPVAPPDKYAGTLENSHILKRAVGVFDPQKDKGSLATWDILRHYVGWDEKRTQHVVETLDTPLNGMLLFQAFHDAWGDFAWTLKPAVDASGNVTADTYEIDVVRPKHFPSWIPKPSGLPINYRIAFKDRGIESAVQDLIPDGDDKLRKLPRPMPDPELIALHRALCWVLHLSGAAEAIDSIFRDAGEAGVQVPSEKIRTTDDLDVLLSSLSLYPRGRA
ncbi:hypothetical protein M422DRAFT_23469 [Sphaerobolus stellatus SS14]|nr:hypothetical protein M422DRAFT_23469 [Sphaerobolus stellatus SS14]